MLLVKDRTLATYDGKGETLRIADVKTIGIHRISLSQKREDNPDPIPDADLDAPELVNRFSGDYPLAEITGGRPPYHVIVRANATATVEQAIPLLVKGAHCGGWNWKSWGVAVVGDFRERPPTHAQWENLRKVCALLACGFREIRAHTDYPTCMDPDPLKRCPGKFLPLEPLISRVMVCQDPPLHPDPNRALELAGFRL